MSGHILSNKVISFFLAYIILFSSCEDKMDSEEQENLSETALINSWIENTMSIYYLWEDELPITSDLEQDPEDFFDGLIVDQDRFSRIFPDYDELIASLSGVNIEAGYELSLVTPDNIEVIGIVTYIKSNPASPASLAGLQRGDVISEINNQTMTVSNYRDVLGQLDESHSISYARYNSDLGELEDLGTMSISVEEYEENPHFLDTIYNVGNRKVGYYVYNFFSGPDFNDQMDQIISDFGNENIDDLIIDFRYNSGGYISAATNLASLIGSNISSNDIYFEYEYNELIQSDIEPGDNQQNFIAKAENIGHILDGQLYIIVGSNTASASELVINGLNPFMQVTLVGDTTIGKNVGSIAIDDENNENNTYGMLPIVFYISNSVGFRDYASGFSPDLQNVVNELTLPMFELGDVREELLSHTLNIISGNDIVAKRKNSPYLKFVGSSLEKKSIYGHLLKDNMK
ncbi:MAG: peptidase [Reichenbachiella sp.]